MLVSGDDEGMLWLYDVSSFLKNKPVKTDDMLEPSRVSDYI